MKSIYLFFIYICVSTLFIRRHYHAVNCAVSFLSHAANGSEENTKFDPRIVGGAIAHEGEARGIVSIQTDKTQHFCAGIWIRFGNKTQILTAAHCVLDRQGDLMPRKLLKIYGDDLWNIQNTPSTRRQIRGVRKIVPHPQYNDYYKDNDIAMIFPDILFEETSTFGPILIADRDIVDNQICEIAGWGHTQENWLGSNELLIANVSVIPREICNGPSSYNGKVGKLAFCAGSMDGGVDTCQSDSGGGITSQNRLIGVISWGEGCGRKNFPGIYTNVYQYRDWIEKTINESSAATHPTILMTIVFAATLAQSIF